MRTHVRYHSGSRGPAVVSVIPLDVVDVSGYSAGPVTDSDRLAALDVDDAAYADLHIGFDWYSGGVAISHAGCARCGRGAS